MDTRHEAGDGDDDEGGREDGGRVERVDGLVGRTGLGLRAALGGDSDDDGRGTAAAELGDGEPLLKDHGPGLSKQLVGVRNRLKEYLAEQAAAGKKLAMTSTARGTYPTMRSTIAFGNNVWRKYHNYGVPVCTEETDPRSMHAVLLYLRTIMLHASLFPSSGPRMLQKKNEPRNSEGSEGGGVRLRIWS